MSEPTVAQKTPIPIEVEEGKKYWWCACGLSNNQPFCDGSHSSTDFTPLEYIATESGRKFFCCCKHTSNQPFCDGSHSSLE